MNSKIEAALKEWIVTSGITLPVVTGLDIETLPVDEQAVVAAVSECEPRAGTLYIATVVLVAASPHHVTTLTAHRILASDLAELVENSRTGTLTAALEDEGFRFAGLCETGTSNDVENGRWLSGQTLRMGLQKLTA